ncbi:MAG: response regulator transcription factor [Pseudomonadota bacterium]|uniref:Response regulator transcription factor n=1 Tax=Polaromonas aquatica TaxID=332657 RepID=A0ABW1U2J2_9BURK
MRQPIIPPVRIFLADDSALIRDRTAAMLASSKLKIVGQADTPESCIAGILEIRPDVVVLDAQFSRGTGLSVLNAVRKVAPEIPFIIFSNHATPGYRTRYMAAGAALFLDKSNEASELARAVLSVSGFGGR